MSICCLQFFDIYMTTVDCLKVGVLAMWGKNGVECFSEFLLKNLLVFRESQSPRSRAYPSIYLYIHLSIYPSIHLSIYPSIHLSTLIYTYIFILLCLIHSKQCLNLHKRSLSKLEIIDSFRQKYLTHILLGR